MLSTTSPFTFLLFSALTNAEKTLGPVVTSSFTWNAKCGATVACGPAAAGFHGTGFAAANNVTFAAGEPIVNGVGKGCGQCWHLMPEKNAYEGNGKKLGTPVVVKINDQCTDPKYCDQYEFGNNSPLNTGYQRQTHFDLCDESGVTKQFFGEVGIGVAIGLAQQVDCDSLDNGQYGQKAGKLSLGGEQNSAVTDALSHIDQGQLNSNELGSGQANDTQDQPPPPPPPPPPPAAAGQPSTLVTSVSSSTPSPSPVPGAEDEQDDCEL